MDLVLLLAGAPEYQQAALVAALVVLPCWLVVQGVRLLRVRRSPAWDWTLRALAALVGAGLGWLALPSAVGALAGCAGGACCTAAVAWLRRRAG